MSIKALIAGGLGFTSGTRFIVTRGLGSGAAQPKLVWADRVHQYSTTSGTGALTVSGRPINKREFASVMNTDDYIYAHIESQTVDGEWEVNRLTMQSDGTLARGTPLRSSNADALVNFSGSKLDVTTDVPAKVIYDSVVTSGLTPVLR